MSAGRPLMYSAQSDPVEHARSWIANPALGELVRHYGGSYPTGDLTSAVSALVSFSRIWDRRSGGERHDVAEGDSDVDAEAIMPFFQQLGLYDPATLPIGQYDWVLILGGTAAACVLRASFVADLIDSRAILPGGVCLLGSRRAVYPLELNAVSSQYATRELLSNSCTELDIQHAVAKEIIIPACAGILDAVDIRVVGAESSDPGRHRANTADTCIEAVRLIEATSGMRLLMVTTHIYVPYQHFVAVRTLGIPYGLDVETIGVPPRRLQRPFTVAEYAQEIRSALLAVQALLIDSVGLDMRGCVQ